MTIEHLKWRIQLHQIELQRLQASHQQMVEEFQKQVQENNKTFVLLTGATNELNALVAFMERENQYEHNPNPNGSDKPIASISGLPGDNRGAGHHLGPPLVHRAVDPSHPAPGEAGAGHHPPDPGDPLGNERSDRS